MNQQDFLAGWDLAALFCVPFTTWHLAPEATLRQVILVAHGCEFNEACILHFLQVRGKLPLGFGKGNELNYD